MASIGEILAAAKTTLKNVVDSAKAALSYIDLWDIAGKAATAQGRFFKFANAWRKNTPGATWEDATEAYYTAGYWANQGKYLSMLDPDIPVPRALASTINRTADQWVAGQNYRYNVDVTIVFGATGENRTFHVYVFSDIPLTQSGAGHRAYNELLSYFAPKSIPESEGGDAQDWEHSESVNSYSSYNQV
jgi:hypothetical protein